MRNLREDLRVPDAKADLYLVGLGIGGFNRRTIETDEALRSCATILHLTAFDKEIREQYTSNIINLQSTYEATDHAVTAYELMEEFVFDHVERNHFLGSVAFMTYGHPLFLVNSGWNLLERCSSLGFRAKALPATSFVDQVLIDLGKRFDAGVQLYEAATFMQHEVAVDPRFPLLLSQVGDFGTDSLRINGNRVARLMPLLEYVKASYPADRMCTLIMSPWRSDMGPEMAVVSVGDIETLVSSIHTGCSVYVDGIYD
ncbi:SAM-dependent methyltransferase [Arthrobacter sp. D5-1]|uniref:SAM-dependent methyltransferase n=1 Tax=Arthrobacter sp. D5-1 TaxID=1477518 RepID=UPI001A97ED21|nr:SAM-dependent methyltransferase [Arthrobacter sp. D5-1]QSZ49201.1 hypothetical protein AYX22_12850 [Arthrobacter sp. D5-1]